MPSAENIGIRLYRNKSGKKIFAQFFSILLFTSFAYSLEIYRPSNFGIMDAIPCHLKITDLKLAFAAGIICGLVYIVIEIAGK